MEGLTALSDTERWSFPLKDMARRKFQTLLTTLSLVVCVSVTVFLVLFGENLGVEVVSFTGGGLTFGFSYILYTFIVVIVLLNSVTGVVIAYFLMSTATSERVRDVGIMKAIGCLTDVVLGYFSTELLIIVFAGCAVGTLCGIILDFASIGLLGLMGFQISAKPLNPLLIMLVFFSFAFISYILGMRRLIKAAGVEPAKALSPLFVWKTEHQPMFRLPSLRRGSFVAKMAWRDMGRRRSLTLQSVACLSVVVASITLAVAGGIIANETTQNYVERAIGRNVILIAEPSMAEQYVSLLNKFLGKGQSNTIGYLDEKYVIPSTVISALSAIDGVLKVDPRLVLENTVYENQATIPDPKEPAGYIVIGDHRSSRALIVGVHAERLVNDWLISGGSLNETEPNDAMVGDSLASAIFRSPLAQSFDTFDSEFKTVGICLDPLNNGNVVYVSFSRLSKIVNHAGYNVLLLKIDSDPSKHSQIINEIGTSLSGTGLTMLELDKVLDGQKAFLSNVWALLLSLSLFSFVNAVLSLTGYLMLSISAQRRDFGIMRALGTKPKTVTKVILFETFLLVLAGGAIGLPVGITAAFWFFIPEAIISQTATMTIAVLLSALMAALCLSSLYPARRITKTSITKAMNQA
jgi:ABC-type antimicrobial peptide transport system permease subunit